MAGSAPTSRGPYRNGIRRREQIVETASKVFAELGYSGGSIRTIATRMDVSPASLLQHFGSKEGLLEAVLEDWARQTEAVVPVDVRGLAHIEGFRRLMDFHLEHRGLMELFLTMAAEASSPVHPARGFIQRRYAGSLDELVHHLHEAREVGEIGQLTHREIETEVRMLFAVMDGLELQWLLDPDVDLPGLFNAYLDEAIRRWKAAPGPVGRPAQR